MNEAWKEHLAATAERIAFRVNWFNERVCALLAAGTVATVWFGVVERYIFTMGATWAEELARYLMIWAALMAVPAPTGASTLPSISSSADSPRPGTGRAA
jgi:TRAP-type C4-dicarboxylate transport system permease small subunit